MFSKETLARYINKPVQLGVRDDSSSLDSIIVGTFRGCDDVHFTLADYQQTYNNNSLMEKPSETGDSKTYPLSQLSFVENIPEVKRTVFSNVYHPTDNPHGSEWWYFTMFGDDDSIMSGNLNLAGAHKRLTGEVDLAIYNAGGEHKAAHVVKRNCRSFEADTSKCDVRIGTDRFYEADGKFNLEIHGKKTSLVLEAVPDPGNIVRAFNFPAHNEGIVQWVVPCLRGRYEGELFKDGKTKKVSGTFFHDHNQDNITRTLRIIKNFKGWAWGVKHGAEETLLYVQIFAKHHPLTFVMGGNSDGVDARSYPLQVSFSDCMNHVDFSFDGQNYTNTFDKSHSVPQSSNRVMNYLINRFAFQKTHRYSSQSKEYCETKMRSVWGRR